MAMLRQCLMELRARQSEAERRQGRLSPSVYGVLPVDAAQREAGWQRHVSTGVQSNWNERNDRKR